MALIIKVRKPVVPAGVTVIQKDILGHLGHLILTSAHGEENTHICKDSDKDVPAVPDDGEGEPLSFFDDEF